MIEYKVIDLFEHLTTLDSQVFVPHVCNDKGAMGSGFVVPLLKHFPKVYDAYIDAPMVQKTVSWAFCGERVVVCNMVAQTLGGKRPLNYISLAVCMDQVREYMENVQKLGSHKPVEIVAPLFGAGLAGGSWEIIRQLIDDCWGRFKVTICIHPAEEEKWKHLLNDNME